MRYFDLGEHLINGPALTTLAKIPNLAAQWKVIHEFNPTEYLKDSRIAIWVKFADECYSLAFSPDGVGLLFDEEIHGGTIQNVIAATQPDQLPLIGEWTRIEITHAVDEETGKYAISVSIAGIEVMKEVELFDWESLGMDATIGLGDPYSRELSMPGVVRGLAVLEKS